MMKAKLKKILNMIIINYYIKFKFLFKHIFLFNFNKIYFYFYLPI